MPPRVVRVRLFPNSLTGSDNSGRPTQLPLCCTDPPRPHLLAPRQHHQTAKQAMNEQVGNRNDHSAIIPAGSPSRPDPIIEPHKLAAQPCGRPGGAEVSRRRRPRVSAGMHAGDGESVSPPAATLAGAPRLTLKPGSMFTLAS
jgi:hypothetical protein